MENGSGEHQYNIPGTKIVHHDPAKKLTVYHALTPKSLTILGSGMKLCTSHMGSKPGEKGTNKNHDLFLNRGNTFIAHHGNKRTQIFIAHHQHYDDEYAGAHKEESFVKEHPEVHKILTKIPHPKPEMIDKE